MVLTDQKAGSQTGNRIDSSEPGEHPRRTKWKAAHSIGEALTIIRFKLEKPPHTGWCVWCARARTPVFMHTGAAAHVLWMHKQRDVGMSVPGQQIISGSASPRSPWSGEAGFFQLHLLCISLPLTCIFCRPPPHSQSPLFRVRLQYGWVWEKLLQAVGKYKKLEAERTEHGSAEYNVCWVNKWWARVEIARRY